MNDIKTTALMATFPDRRDALLESVPSILRQVDKLYIYLNEYDSVPNELIHPRITTLLGKDYAGDIKDNGKIIPFSLFDIKGFCFLVDDDIVYPTNYVSNHITKIKQHGYHIITGLHGVVLHPPIHSYFKNRSVFHYLHASNNHYVDILGTGTIAFHTKTFTPDYHYYTDIGMCDILLGLEAKQKGIPLLSIQRGHRWMTDVLMRGALKKRLYKVFVHNDARQSELLRESGFFDAPTEHLK